MLVKVSLLKSILHESNEFRDELNGFLNNISKISGNEIEISSLDDYDCDLKLIFIASGGSEGLFLENINTLKEPYYLLTTGSNNSLAASLEILTYLNNNQLQGEVLHGSVEYISERINLLGKKKVNDTVKLGVLGKPSDWLISSIPNYQKIKDIFGIELVDLSLDEVVSNYKNEELKQLFNTNYFDNNELARAYAFSCGMKKLVDKYGLSGVTIRCFDLLDKIKMTGCIALSELNDMGIIGTCEGDIMALITMYLVKKYFNESSFQANPSEINTIDNTIIFAHCTAPTDMFTSYKYDTHFESKIGVALKGELKESDITIFRISSDLKNYFVSNGKILENLDRKNLCRTQVRVSLEEDVSSLLKHPCGNHHIIFYGHHANEINELMAKYIK